MSKSKAKGTAWESAVVDCLQTLGVPHAERRALNGAADKGDIAGLPGVVIECKNAARVELGSWVDEAVAERDNARAAVGVVWHKRRGHTAAALGFVTMPGWQFVQLLREAGYIAEAKP